MCFTSDQQLAALGLCRMEDLPQRRGYQFVGRERTGNECVARVAMGEAGETAAVQEIYDTRGIVCRLRKLDLIGWRPA